MYRKGRDTEEQERQTEEEKGIHELKRGIRKTGMAKEEGEQQRKTMDKAIKDKRKIYTNIFIFELSISSMQYMNSLLEIYSHQL